MNRMVSLRVGAAFASVAMALAGCTCDTPMCDTSDLTVSFVAPADGAMVEQTSNVQVSLARRGTAVNIGTAKLEIRGPGGGDFGGARNGTVDGSNATFTGVMLAAGENALRATVAEANCTGSAAPVTIVVTAKTTVTPPPVVTACTFPQDSNGDGTLNATELPAGTAVQLRVTTTNGSGATLSAPNSNPAMAPIMNDAATISVPGPAADGTFTIAAAVTRGAATAMCPTTPSIQVRRMATCTIENTTSITPRGPLDDANTQAAGFQIRATAQLNSGAVASAQLANGNDVAQLTFAGGMASADFTVPATGTQTYSIVVRGTDATGNPCQVVNATRMVPVDFDPPVVTITSPMNGATIASPNANLVASVTGADGRMCQAFVNGTPDSTATVMSGTVTFPLTFPGNGSYALRVECTDAAQNRGSSGSQLADGGRTETVVTVQLPVNICSVTFASVGGETSCPAFVTRLTGGALNVTLTRSANCIAQPLRLFRDNVAVSGTGPTFNVPVGMATANFTLRAEIDNLPGATPAITTTSCAVDVNTNVPAITSPLAPVSGPAIINAAADTQPGSPGAQRQFTFTAAVPPMGRVDVCVDSAAIAGMGSPACPGPAGWFVLASNVTSPAPAFTFPEGTYQIKIVVMGGAMPPPESDPLSVLVDVTTPCVSMAGVTLPQDVGADGGIGDGNLNLAELGAGSPQIRFAVDPACGTATTADFRSVNGTVFGSSLASPMTNPSGTVNTSLTLVNAEQDVSLFVQLTDAVGNSNGLTTNTSARKNFRSDRVAPTCAFLDPPTGRTLNLTDIPGGSLAARVQTSPDVALVPISEGANAPQNVAPNTTGVATASFTVSGTRTLTFNAACRDGVGNSTPAAARMVDIDLDPPSFTLSAPTAGFSSSTTSVVTTATMVTGSTANIRIQSSAQAPDVGVLTSAGGYSATLTYPIGANQTITARLLDAAGNEAVRTVSMVSVTSTNCQVTLSSMNGNAPFVRGATTWINRSHVPGAGASSGTTTIRANSSNCRTGELVTLTRVSPAGGPVIPPATTNTSGDVSFSSVAVADGEVWAVSIVNNPTPTQFSVDLIAPQLTGGFRINTDTAAPPASVFFVAATNNERVNANTPGYYPDGDGNSGNGAQASFTVSGVQGAVNGTFEVRVGSTSVIPVQSVTMSPQTFTSVAGVLAHNTSAELAAVVIDEGGNSIDAFRGPAVVDVIPPSAPTGQDAGVVNPRDALGSISWLNDTVDDVGTPSSGAPARYVVKWTTNSVTGNNGMATSADFFGSSTSAAIERAPAGASMLETITLPPLNTYHLAVRSRDEVHNYSTFTGPHTRDNFWTRIKLDGPANSSFGNAVSAESSINNDSIPDLLVGAMTLATPGALYVYYGTSNLASQPSCVAPACQVLTTPDGLGNGYASDFSAFGNVGDVADAGAKADLLVGQSVFPLSSQVGRAFLYFGSSSSDQIDAGTFIEFRGADNAGRIGGLTKIIPDINGDGLSEVLFSAPFANTNNGQVFIYAGRSLPAWQMARTATDATTLAPFIPVSSANATWTIQGGAVSPTPPAYFARSRFSVAPLGDLDGDGRGDFTIGLGPETINRLQLWTSATVGSATMPIANASRLQDLSQPVGVSPSATQGLGAFVLGGINILNGPAQDMIATWVAKAGGGVVLLYADLGASGAPVNPTYTITGPLLFGSGVGAANLNTSDNRPDLVVGTSNTSNSVAWVIWQQAGSTAFDANLVGGPVFWTSRFDGNALSASTNNSIGRSAAAVDLDGNAQADVILADERNSTVYVWR